MRVLVAVRVGVWRTVWLLAAVVMVGARVRIEAKDGGTHVNWIDGWPKVVA